VLVEFPSSAVESGAASLFSFSAVGMTENKQDHNKILITANVTKR
jgi:hypothetical protein